ncbi:MAG: aminoacyltransferase [Firmicutes bacterium]|nr:aminoacyltransferase [Bacillota bacterium]
MKIIELSEQQFNEYIIRNNYNSIYQTPEYAGSMRNQGYNSILLGLMDNDQILGATVILIHNRKGFKYAYAPRGFLIDYTNDFLVKKFTTEIKKYLSHLDVIAVKLSPMIIKNMYNSNKELTYHNEDYNRIYLHLKSLGYYHLGYNNYFESLKPRFEAVLNIDKPYYELFNKIKKSFRTKIRNADKNGIRIYKGDINNIQDLYVHTKRKYPRNDFYFADIYNKFGSKAELFYTKLDTKKYLVECQKNYQMQDDLNTRLDNEILINVGHNEKLINQKLVADKLLHNYRTQLLTATNLLKEYPEGIITASILIVINQDTVYLYMDGYDKKYQHLNSKHLLLWKLIERYSGLGYKKFNLGGVINIFSSNEKYNGLNEFKLNFNPNIIEYLGDLELICNSALYFMYKNSIPVIPFLKK